MTSLATARRNARRLARKAATASRRQVDALHREVRGHSDNPLEAYFEANNDRLIHKWMHYFDIYDRHFAPYRGKPITVVEFGVSEGGSLQMWRDYFGPKARIVGVDIDPRCAALTGPGIEIAIGDQEDRSFLSDLAKRVGPVDVLIEDGGHRPKQQINTFEVFWPVIRGGGVFLIEDLHTSYWANYDGGYLHPGTFNEYAKDFIDKINAYHSKSPELTVDDYTKTMRGMHVYDSIIVFDKARAIPRPTHRRTGNRAR